MDKQTFREFSINPDSYQDVDMPGYWFPRATVDGPAGALVSLAPLKGIDKGIADALAVREAKRRISVGQL